MAKKPATRAKAGTGTAKAWLEKIDAAIAREKTWRTKSKKVVQRFRDERARGDNIGNSTRVNILWANTEILKSALYPRTSKPDVRRRFPDGKVGNTAARVAAEVIERALYYVIDTEAVDGILIAAIEDLLLPGRGVIWISYEPEIAEPEETDETGARDTGGGDTDAKGTSADSGEKAEASGEIVSQRLTLEYVYWEDYCQGLARQDKDVPWRARRHALTEEEFEKRFPEAKGKRVATDYRLSDNSGDNSEIGGSHQDQPDLVEAWEVWAIGGKKRLYVARGYPDILQETTDPYLLTGFFPCPTPLRGVTTTDRQMPQPEFLQYQDQAIELDAVETRISKLTKEMKWRGIYDATIPDGGSPGGSTLADMSKADDGEFLPHSQFQAIRDRGGIDAAFGFMPIERIVAVIAELDKRADKLLQRIYEITGISDIIRGSSDPQETYGAQGLKAQFGSLRLQSRQREVQRFIRDAYRMLAEVIAEHFTQETLAEMTGFDLPTAVEQQQLKQKLAQLQAQMQPPQGPPGMPAPQIPGRQQPLQIAPPRPGPPLINGAGPPPMPPQSGPAGMGGPPQIPGMSGAPGAPPSPQGAPGAPGQPPQKPQIPAPILKLIERANGPNWDDVMKLLRSDKLRGYRVDVETDATELQDDATVQENRVKFMEAFNAALEKAYIAATTAPMMLPLIKESLLMLMRTYKAGRTLEQAVEDAFDQLENNPPPGMGGANNPKMQAIMAQTQAKITIAQAQAQADLEKTKADVDAKKAESQARIALMEREYALHEKKALFDAGLAGRVEEHSAAIKVAARPQLRPVGPA